MFLSVIKYLGLLVVNLVADVVGWLLNPFVVLFVTKEEKLPTWLSWFDTPDNTLEGDIGWRTEHWQWRFKLTPILARYVGRVGWLWRNNAYGFSFTVLGITIKEGFKLTVDGDYRVSNRPLHEGLVVRYLVQDGKTYFHWYYVKAWGTKDRCVRINIGWKLWGDLRVGDNRAFVMSPNPSMGWSRVA